MSSSDLAGGEGRGTMLCGMEWESSDRLICDEFKQRLCYTDDEGRKFIRTVFIRDEENVTV